MKPFKVLYPYRFHIFLFTQLLVLFGSLIIPVQEWESLFLSVFLLFNLMGGFTILSRRKKLFYTILFLIGLQIFVAFWKPLDSLFMKLRTGLFLVLYVLFFVEVLHQIIREKKVNSEVILGMFSGYITLGFIGLFLLQLIILQYPDALYFNIDQPDTSIGTSQLMYFSFITLLSIGYGDIAPVVPTAQKTAILLGLSGQFYLTVVIAMIVGKYLRDK
ncbi:two pore domain potassium channel family protein [Robertkochia marina]|uniref:Two pore domain potassium channel family protein n=1 Tax=Robertkochia marina TaxID=1227945 RepID=A0A4S3M2I7_9FLAO|nr:ion channel [Robertkochia marina]THD69276.1 two pore domain potassium channel family protein [Robertkochia marina]TRZ47465.1 two pore domain potassium channel family protein [Robertkochia marina]